MLLVHRVQYEYIALPLLRNGFNFFGTAAVTASRNAQVISEDHEAAHEGFAP